mmetsp:Transcript_5396/g.13335  ORF Transcript_5396/g.13335 Transcript_5396/m.13335 type:complete len:294 (+) Transcript_5396:1732-2613(+)
MACEKKPSRPRAHTVLARPCGVNWSSVLAAAAAACPSSSQFLYSSAAHACSSMDTPCASNPPSSSTTLALNPTRSSSSLLGFSLAAAKPRSSMAMSRPFISPASSLARAWYARAAAGVKGTDRPASACVALHSCARDMRGAPACSCATRVANAGEAASCAAVALAGAVRLSARILDAACTAVNKLMRAASSWTMSSTSWTTSHALISAPSSLSPPTLLLSSARAGAAAAAAAAAPTVDCSWSAWTAWPFARALLVGGAWEWPEVDAVAEASRSMPFTTTLRPFRWLMSNSAGA